MTSIRTRWIAAAALMVLTTGAAIARAPLGEVKTLVFVLHGDAPFVKPSYQYAFAADAAKLPASCCR